jgi:N4-gp56 family major capsid protein
MATTTKTDVSRAIPTVYGRRILNEARKTTFLNRFTGLEGSGMPIIAKEELTKEPGDTIRITTVKNLTGAGVTNDDTLEGNEEKLVIDDVEVTITQYRHAVRYNKTARQQSILQMAEASVDGLSYWTSQKLESLGFTELVNSPDHIIYGGDATTLNGIDATDVMSTTTISKAKAKAEEKLMRPVQVQGELPFYVMVIHPFQAYSLKVSDTTWQQAQREAMPRGSDNPIFSGALGMWDGVILYAHPNVSRALNANSPAVYVGKAVLMGAECMAHAFGQHPELVVKSFDYDNQFGTAISFVTGYKKSDLDNTDTGVVCAYTAAADPNA